MLLPLAALFGALLALRRLLHRLGWRRPASLAVPVVVVGNFIVGGAGKTPTVIALAELLRSRGWNPGIVSRGYGGAQTSVLEVDDDGDPRRTGDEPLLLRLRTAAPVVVGRDRVAAARELLRRHPGVDVIISDDGLQHLRLPRIAQVVVFDERGAGNGWLLPAGPLREPLPVQVPPRTLVLYNADHPTTALPGSVARRRLAGVVSLSDWVAGKPASSDGLRSLASRPLLAAAGMASPSRFFSMLRAAGLAITPLVLPDHFDFAELPWPDEDADVIVTEKDAVKLRHRDAGRARIWVAPLDFGFDPRFEHDLLALLPRARPRNSDGQPTA